MRKRVVAFVVLVLLAAACSGSEKARPAAGPESLGASATPSTLETEEPAALPDKDILAEESPPEPPTVSEEEVEQVESRRVSELQLRDFRFLPGTLTGTAGGSFNVRLFNLGKVEHNFTIVTPESGTISKDVTPQMAEGLGFLAPKKPGRYAFYCRFHRDRGMTGTLVVGSSRP